VGQGGAKATTLSVTVAVLDAVIQGQFMAPRGQQSPRPQDGGQTQSSVQTTPKVNGLSRSVLEPGLGQPVSTPVIGSRFTHDGMPAPVSTSQKKTLCAGLEQVQQVELNVGPVKGMHSCNGGEFQTRGLISKAAWTGRGFSASAPRTSDSVNMVTRHIFRTADAVLCFLKFRIVI
jgi:hypothetical protein